MASPRVLIVEDNEMNRDMLSRRLQRRGFDTIVTVDGEEGLAAAFRDKPNLIIMDMGLPVLDGWEATRRLKSSEETRSIPIIALTADAMLGDRDKAFEAGVDDFDTKPVDFNRLLKKIDALLGPRAGP